MRFGVKNTLRRPGVKDISGQGLHQRSEWTDLTGQEGAARQTKKEFINYLHMSQGSLSELDTQLELAKRLGYLDATRWQSLDGEMPRVDKMLSGLIRHQKSH